VAIAASGIASRREAERMIAAGRVSVNKKVIKVQGVKVDPDKDDICVDGKSIKTVTEKIYLMLNKPRGVLCTASDPENRKTIFNLLGDTASSQGAKRVFHVGRLDYNSEGLILLTNDGELTHMLTHPSNLVPRVYQVRIQGEVDSKVIKRIVDGVQLDDGKAQAIDAQVIRRNPKSTWVELTLLEGRNRLVRRLFEAVGCHVLRLIRVSYGGIQLGNLRPAKFRKLTKTELGTLRNWRKRKAKGRRRIVSSR
jgi:23S rRNA pseudouridine2605 synthase